MRRTKEAELIQVQEVSFDPAIKDTDVNAKNPKKQAKVLTTKTLDPNGPYQTVEDLKNSQESFSEHEMTGCVIELEHNIFNLQNLRMTDYDYNVTYKGTKEKPNNFTVFFNICEYTKHKCSTKDSTDSAHFININNTCSHATDKSLSDQKVYLQNSNYPDYGLKLKFLNGQKCTNDLNYALEVQINCVPDAEKTTFTFDEESIKKNECHPKVIMTSAAGCPVFSMGPLWKWSDHNKYIVGTVLLLIGALLILLGPKRTTASLSLTAFFGMFCFVILFLHGFVMPFWTPEWMVWITIVMAVLIGVGAAVGVVIWPKGGVISVGIVLGTITGTLVYIMFFSDMTGNPALDLAIQQGRVTQKVKIGDIYMTVEEIQWGEWKQMLGCILGCCLIFSIMSVIFFEEAVIFGTCVIGSYLCVRGLSKFIGGFPNEFLIFDSMKNHSFLSNGMMTIVYIFLFVVMSIAMVSSQWKNRQEIKRSTDFKKYDFKYRAPSS